MVGYRIIINFDIVEKLNNKTNYDNNKIYSMFINNLSSDISKKIHSKEKHIRLFSFSKIYIQGNKAHIYFCGEQNLIEEFIKHISFRQLVRIEDMVLKVINIKQLQELQKKDTYVFKTNFIINRFNKELNKTELMKDMSVVKQRLLKNTLEKARICGVDGDIDFAILDPKIAVTKYKNGHIFSYRCNLIVKGDYEVVNVIYSLGLGENTSSGHGFLWESRCF